MDGEARQVIERDGTTVIVPATCPYCGRARMPVKSGVIGVFECGTAVNFRSGGLGDQTSECKRLEITTLRARVAELEAALREIEAAALRENGPLARDHDGDTLRGIGLHAQFVLREPGERT